MDHHIPIFSPGFCSMLDDPWRTFRLFTRASFLGAEACGGPLLGARVAELRCAAPVSVFKPEPRGSARLQELPVELAFDLRLFEPAEAAAFLADVERRLDELPLPAEVGAR